MRLQTVTPPLSTRPRREPPTAIVLHATAGATARSSIEHLRALGLSYHYIVARDGKDHASAATADGGEPVVFALVDPACRAAHVGSQIPFPNGRTANQTAVGVALANRQNGEPYQPAQLEALDALIAALMAAQRSLRLLTTHAAIQPWNRADPLALDGAEIASRHGLSWFEPTPAQITAFRSPRLRVA